MANILFLDSYVLRFTLPNILLKVSIGYGSSIMFGNLIFHLWKQNKAMFIATGFKSLIRNQRKNNKIKFLFVKS